MTDASMTAVYGSRGQGKSTLTKTLLRSRRRVLAFDPNGEYAAAGCRPVEWSEIPGVLTRAMKSGKGFKVSYVPKPGCEIDALHVLSAALMRSYVGKDHLTLVVEEMNGSFPNGLPRDKLGFKAICERGRHRGIEVIGVTQRPASVSTIFRGLCDDTYIFRLDWANDVDAICKMIGRGHADALRSLAVHEYLHYSQGKLARGKNSLKK